MTAVTWRVRRGFRSRILQTAEYLWFYVVPSWKHPIEQNIVEFNPNHTYIHLYIENNKNMMTNKYIYIWENQDNGIFENFTLRDSSVVFEEVL